MNKYFPSDNIKNYDFKQDLFNVSFGLLIDLKFAGEENCSSVKNNRTLQLKFKESSLTH